MIFLNHNYLHSCLHGTLISSLLLAHGTFILVEPQGHAISTLIGHFYNKTKQIMFQIISLIHNFINYTSNIKLIRVL
jgi:hypothetical protein